MDVFEANRTMLAVRRYQDRPIAEEVVRRIVEAGRLTGSSRNLQPWHFVVVQDRERLQALASRCPTGPFVAGAALAITLAHERESRVPNVTVNGSYWREIGREAFSAGLSVPTPLWYQRQGEITEAFGAMRQQEAEWLRARNELVRAVTQHYQDAKTAAEQIEVFERGLLKQAQEALRIAQFSFQQGTASLLEVLDAQRVYRQTQLEYAQARYELSVARAKLERSVGGTL